LIGPSCLQLRHFPCSTIYDHQRHSILASRRTAGASGTSAAIARLFDHQEQRRFAYEHVWRVGDILMWDNRCSLHARTDFSPAERRLMRRITILGEKPE
jgi:taurine dioxygenase